MFLSLSNCTHWMIPAQATMIVVIEGSHQQTRPGRDNELQSTTDVHTLGSSLGNISKAEKGKRLKDGMVRNRNSLFCLKYRRAVAQQTSHGIIMPVVPQG